MHPAHSAPPLHLFARTEKEKEKINIDRQY